MRTFERTMTERDWELLSGIDEELTNDSFDCNKMEDFLFSITLEEMAALCKWVCANAYKSFPMYGDCCMNDETKAEVIKEYIRANIEECFSNIENVADMIKVWKVIYELM